MYTLSVPEIVDITGDNQSAESLITAQAQQIYCQRAFSDEFHQFTEICMEKRPANRWSALQLLNHSFFKHCRHTSILDQLKRFGMEVTDYDGLRDHSLAASHDMSELSLKHDWSWDF
ncbi:putative serine/threonine-protein kinase STE20-like [Teleopsis dalmanni]|uniref:putative serine/threonine-protein kinase STE20-like n=1 Tax=Teleopsis dalmanni TaxID=139649 RepID=UPI0018CE3B63|nr:putative serine/threonine-protein kinase STE20-like [Teleopsis dalmanni]